MIVRSNNNLVIENAVMQVTLEPDNGGKIRSLISKRTGAEYFFQDPRSKFDPARGYSYHDISGLDECFPNVAPCQFTSGKNKGVELDDHGSLWQRRWNNKIDSDALLQWVDDERLQFRFTRVCRFNNNELRLDYTIHNYGIEPLDYVYSTHPLLVANEHTKLELPKTVQQIYVTAAWGSSNLKENKWVNVPLSPASDLCGPYAASRQMLFKAFTQPQQAPWVRVHRRELGETLEVRGDAANLPHMGILVSQGFDTLGDGDFKGQFLLGIEPTSGIGDDHQTCVQTQTLRQLATGQITNFWVAFSLKQTL